MTSNDKPAADLVSRVLNRDNNFRLADLGDRAKRIGRYLAKNAEELIVEAALVASIVYFIIGVNDLRQLGSKQTPQSTTSEPAYKQEIYLR